MQEQMTKQDAIEYLLYLKHDVQAKSPMDIALDTAIEVLKQPTIEPEVLMIKSDAARSLTDEEAAIFEEWLNHDAVIEPEVRHGRWITKDSKTAKCSCCGWWQRAKTYYLPDDIHEFSRCYRFCTSCGTQMDGGANNA